MELITVILNFLKLSSLINKFTHFFLFQYFIRSISKGPNLEGLRVSLKLLFCHQQVIHFQWSFVELRHYHFIWILVMCLFRLVENHYLKK